MPTSTPISLMNSDVGMFDGLGQLLMILLLMLLVIGGAYYFTRFIGKSFGGQGGSHGSMQVVDRLAVAQNKTVLLVRVGERCFLIGVSQHNLTQLGEMLADELPDVEAPPQNAPDRVASYLAGIIKGKNTGRGGGSFSETLRQERDVYDRSGDPYAQDGGAHTQSNNRYDQNDDRDGDRP